MTVNVSIRELVDPKLLATVEDLDFIARWVVEGFLHGLHRSPYVGFSVDFASHREYIPGDDLRHLNWKLYGRHDRLYVKQYDAQTNVDLHIVVDASGSMTAADGQMTKMRYATLLAASLAHLATQQRDAIGLTIFADSVVDHFQAKVNSDHLLSLMSALSQTRAYPPSPAPLALHEVAELIPRRGLVVLISDLYYEPDELLSTLDHFRHFGHDVLVFHVLTSIEYELPLDGNVKLLDAETGEQIETVGHEIRESYRASVQQWLDDIHQGCLARDIEHRPIVTTEPLEDVLMSYFLRRAQLNA